MHYTHKSNNHLSITGLVPIATLNCSCTLLLVYEIIVGFSRDFYETILVGKFQSHEIGASRSSLVIITQLYPINRNFTGSRCNIIAKLNAALLGRCRPAHAHDGVPEVVWSLPHAVRQSGTGWYISAVGQSNTASCVWRRPVALAKLRVSGRHNIYPDHTYHTTPWYKTS